MNEHENTILAYRVDRRDFQPGEVIASAKEYLELSPERARRVEELFEQARPENKPRRTESLFLFENLTVAKKHWSKMSDGKLYEMKIAHSAVLHRGDMRLIDIAGDDNDDEKVQSSANQYWSGETTDRPRIEILVATALVTKVISKDQEERRRYLPNWDPE
jgi:hypothetical protein